MGAVAERVFAVAGGAGSEPGPAMRAALLEMADFIRSAWLEEGAAHNNGGAYLQQIADLASLEYPYLDDPWAAAIVATAPEADWLEEGRAGFHLPAHWGRGTGVWQQGKNGPYAHVAFRHGVPLGAGGFTPQQARRAMPTARFYNWARELLSQEGNTRLTAADLAHVGTRRPEDWSEYRESKSYTYYRQNRDIADDVPDYLPGGYTWAASRYEGMTYRHEVTPGGGHHSVYTTVRTITPDSPGWFIPPTPAYHLAARALERAELQIQLRLDAAAAADAAAAIVDATRGLFE